MFANRVRKRPMDASHAISIAVQQARDVAESCQSATIVHLCPGFVVPRIVVSRRWALIFYSRPSAENRPRIPCTPSYDRLRGVLRTFEPSRASHWATTLLNKTFNQRWAF